MFIFNFILVTLGILIVTILITLILKKSKDNDFKIVIKEDPVLFATDILKQIALDDNAITSSRVRIPITDTSDIKDDIESFDTPSDIKTYLLSELD